MSVKYVLVERGNPAKPTDPHKWYAQHKSAGEITVRELMTEISQQSTVSPADVMAVLESFLGIIPAKLSQGMIVRLGDFGSFSASITSAGVADPEKFSTSLIRRYNIRFRPGQELNRAVAAVEYRREAKPKDASA